MSLPFFLGAILQQPLFVRRSYALCESDFEIFFRALFYVACNFCTDSKHAAQSGGFIVAAIKITSDSRE